MTDTPPPLSHDSTILPAPAADAPQQSKGRAWRVVGLVALILAFVASAALATYLWLVSSQWIDQNDVLRSEASELGDELASTQAEVADLESQVETLEQQLETTSSRLSDVVNDEANAGDDVQYLADLIEAYGSCVDSYDDVLTDALTDGYTYSNSNARSVQNDVAEYCDSLADAYQEYVSE